MRFWGGMTGILELQRVPDLVLGKGVSGFFVDSRLCGFSG